MASKAALAIEANMLIVRLFKARRQPGANYDRVSRVIARADERATRRQDTVLRNA